MGTIDVCVPKPKTRKRVPVRDWESNLPARFEAVVRYSDTNAVMRLDLSFDGVRVKVESVTVNGDVTPTALARLRLAEAVHAACMDIGGLFIPSIPEGMSDETVPSNPRMAAVLAIYEFHEATWGNPRREVIDYFGCSRTTANRWITASREHMGR